MFNLLELFANVTWWLPEVEGNRVAEEKAQFLSRPFRFRGLEGPMYPDHWCFFFRPRHVLCMFDFGIFLCRCNMLRVEGGKPRSRARLSLCRARPFLFIPVGVEGPKYSSFGSRIIGASSFDSDMSQSPIAKRR